MKVYPERLQQQLKQISPVYLVWGDEPLTSGESCDLIRRAVLASGEVERLRYQVDPQFEWAELHDQVQSLSLFTPFRLIELHFDKAPDKSSTAPLKELLDHQPSDICLLLSCPQLSKAQQNQAWYQAVDSKGVIVPIYAPIGPQLNQWVTRRLQSRQVKSIPGLVELIQHYYEGNLLALSQAIDAIAMRWPDQLPTLAVIESGMDQSSHFSHHQLVDALFDTSLQRARHIARQLYLEGEDLTLVTWLTDKDLQLISQLQTTPGQSSLLFNQHRVWRNRQGLLLQAAKRLNRDQVRRARLLLADIDKANKSFEPEQGWLKLEQLMLTLSDAKWQFVHE
jgi:DNA polymerase-3 subunit delta